MSFPTQGPLPPPPRGRLGATRRGPSFIHSIVAQCQAERDRRPGWLRVPCFPAVGWARGRGQGRGTDRESHKPTAAGNTRLLPRQGARWDAGTRLSRARRQHAQRTFLLSLVSLLLLTASLLLLLSLLLLMFFIIIIITVIIFLCLTAVCSVIFAQDSLPNLDLIRPSTRQESV